MAGAEQYETILTERIGLVERITLNRPEKRNALSPLLQDELIDAVHAAERGNEVRVIVIRGAGPSFCSGYDISCRRRTRRRSGRRRSSRMSRSPSRTGTGGRTSGTAASP
jgi:enoyl-CoA hydratase/carnithine racemase